jgi:alanine-glyoxylate transaminase/serine-glyoxylate transaminase/serine-pyruvate transaminase
VTALAFAPEIDPERLRERCRERYGVAFGGGIGPFRGHLLRIGHMGDLDEAMILGALGVLELALRETGVAHGRGGVEAAVEALAAG